jgi:hypothetical protein
MSTTSVLFLFWLEEDGGAVVVATSTSKDSTSKRGGAVVLDRRRRMKNTIEIPSAKMGLCAFFRYERYVVDETAPGAKSLDDRIKDGTREVLHISILELVLFFVGVTFCWVATHNEPYRPGSIAGAVFTFIAFTIVLVVLIYDIWALNRITVRKDLSNKMPSSSASSAAPTSV